jgi:hypothetical protein
VVTDSERARRDHLLYAQGVQSSAQVVAATAQV